MYLVLPKEAAFRKVSIIYSYGLFFSNEEERFKFCTLKCVFTFALYEPFLTRKI